MSDHGYSSPIPFPAVENYFNRGSNGGLTIWYTGAANQTAHSTVSHAANTFVAYPLILDGGVLDTIAFEVTSGGAGSTARVGLYANTSDQTLYPSSLIVDGGEFDTSSAAVKAATISKRINPGLYWLAYLCTATAPTVRAIAVGATSHMVGLPTAMGANLETMISVALTYAALPSTFTAGAAVATGTRFLGAVHYSS